MMSFKGDMISVNKDLSKSLREPFGDFEDESDTEETTTLAIESVPVPSINVLTADLETSVCKKRIRQEPGDTTGKKIRLMESGEVTDSESEGEDTTTLDGEVAPIPSNNILVADLRQSLCNKRKCQEPGDISGKRMRQKGPDEMNLVDSGGDVQHTQTVILSSRALDGAGDRQRSIGNVASAVDTDDIFPGYSMGKVDFIVHSMRRHDKDPVVPGKSVKIGDVRTVFQYRSWLNDEAISSYMQLIIDRDPCKVYAYNTYFYPMLSLCGYDAVRNWGLTKNIFRYDRVLIPIYEKFHWTLVCVDFNVKTIKYYDSLGMKNLQCLKLVLDYLMMESKKKVGKQFNSDEWQLFHAEDCPKKLNYDDCGVFTCVNAEYLARGVKLDFTQSSMPKLRHRICYEILTDRLLFGLDGSRAHG